MPRSQTPAAERTEQNRRLKQRVETEVGHPVSRAEAEAHQRAKRGRGRPIVPSSEVATKAADHLVPDRILDFTSDELTLVGTVLAKVQDCAISRGYAKFTLITSPEFAHTLADAVLLSGHSLQITLHEIGKPKDDEDTDASEA